MENIKPSIEEIKLDHKDDCVETKLFVVKQGYSAFYTDSKDAAFQVWTLMSEHFFSLKEADNNEYGDPKFNWKGDIDIELKAETKNIWKNETKAKMAAYAYKELREAARRAQAKSKEQSS